LFEKQIVIKTISLTKKERDGLSPLDVLKRLMWGNFRFNQRKKRLTGIMESI
jgi:hypothetical protein